MTTGAGGDGMHSLIASTASGVSVNLLKTSPINAKLQAMYNLQSQSSMYWGKNTITYRNAISGDLHIMQECAFKKAPEMAYAKEGGIVTWDFDAIKTASVLGTGTPEA
jgi:hypothetical protein